MATTSPDNIWTPDTGDDYALTVDLAAMADTVQAALTSSSTKTAFAVANQAARDAKYPTPAAGNRVFRLDLGLEQLYWAGAWKTQASRFVGARVIKNIGQSTTTGTNSITWNSTGAEYDSDNMYNSGVNTRINIPYSGIWLVSYTLRTNGTGAFTARVGINGTGVTSTEGAAVGASGAATTVNGFDLLNLTVGDYIFVQHEAAAAGSSFNVSACRFQARFMGQL